MIGRCIDGGNPRLGVDDAAAASPLMLDTATKVCELLHEASETHHRVFRIVDGDDADWASWYADWLIDLSELPDLLGTTPVRSELVYLLVALDKEYTSAAQPAAWEDFYAHRLIERFTPPA